MRTIRILAHISLDGLISPGGRGEPAEFENGGWTAPFRHPEGAAAIAAAQGASFDLLLGRRTYDMWSDHWPKMTGGPFADKFNAATKYVATHRPDGLGWGPAKDLGPDVPAGVRQLKATDGPDLLTWGSTMLTATLIDQGLVDEVVLVTYPVLLGQGTRFFGENGERRELALVATKSLPTGVLINTYRHVGVLRPKA